jgi:heme-degrading monooxygenase HmoA
MSFTSIIRFHVKPGSESAFEDAFAKAGMLTRPSAITGFVKANLVRSLDDPAAYYVIGEWQTVQAYKDWQAVSGPEADPEALAAMRATLIEHAPGRLFQTVA